MAFTINHVKWEPNPSGLKDFLSGVFGWQFAPFGENYFVTEAQQTGATVGVNKNPRANGGNGTPSVYIDVTCMPETFAIPQTVMGPLGSFGFIKAPDGNLIGLFEYAKA